MNKYSIPIYKMPINLSGINGRIEMAFGDAFNQVQKCYEALTRPINSVQQKLGIFDEEEQQNFIIQLQDSVKHYQMPDIDPKLLGAQTFMPVQLQNVQNFGKQRLLTTVKPRPASTVLGRPGRSQLGQRAYTAPKQQPQA